MYDKEIIFITAFKDINRTNWKHYDRSTSSYINYFYTLSDNIKYKLIVYLEKDVKDIIVKNKSFNENIIFEDLDNVNTFFNKFIENDKKIIQSEIYKNKIPDYRKNSPEHIYSEYNLINHSKINFLRDTKEKYPDYNFYAWIDFGRMNESIENIPKNIDISLIPKNKITYHFVNDPPLNRISEDEMLKSHAVYLLGSSFIVPNELVEYFENIFENKLSEWQEKYITDDDQNLVLQLYFDNPALFHGIKNKKWYNMYANLRKDDCYNSNIKESIPKIFFQTSIDKPEQYIVDKILSKCEEYKYYHFDDNEIINFFKENYIEEFKNIIEKFNSIDNGAHKADLFRYYFLYLNGGIYMDADMMIQTDIKNVISDNISFVSILSSHHQCGKTICNAFIASTPKNEIIYKALKNVYEISNASLSGFYHILCKNLFIIVNDNYNFKIKLLIEENWDNCIKRGYDYVNVYDDKDQLILIHYCIDKKIPK